MSLHRAKMFAFVSLGLLVLALPMGAEGSERGVGGGQVSCGYGGCTFFATDAGNIYSSRYVDCARGDYTQQPWGLVGNLFDATGTSHASPLVVADVGCGGAFAMARNGDFYFVSQFCDGIDARLVSNVFAQAGAPSGEIVAVTSCGTHQYAVTAGGDVFRRGNGSSCCPDTWESAGNLFAGSPVPALPSTWGQLKARYRESATPTPSHDH